MDLGAAEVHQSDYFATATGLSFRSLHVTLVHILVAEVVWLARWEGGSPPERLKDARKVDRLATTAIATFEALTELWRFEEAKQRRFFSALTDEVVSKTIAYKNQYDEPNEQPLSQLIAHVVNHGTQFRAEGSRSSDPAGALALATST